MPLIPGIGQDVVSENIRNEIRAGRPKKQAAAIAYANQRESRKAKRGRRS